MDVVDAWTVHDVYFVHPIHRARWFRSCLLANAEFVDDVLVALGIVAFEVIEQAAALAYHHQETAAGGVILLVRLEVFRQLSDTFAEHRDLHLGAAGVVVVSAVPGNDVLFSLSC